MAQKREIHLPIHGHGAADGDLETTGACEPTAYVSNEEAAILSALRALREEAAVIREKLDRCRDRAARSELESELERLRGRREELTSRRERAYVRKMIMLGHLPPDSI